MIKLKHILRETEEFQQLPSELKKHFLEIISTYGQHRESMSRKSDIRQVAETLGGIEKIVANEGLVFVYNGKTYKLTGTFAPLNQILGIFYS